MPLHRARRTDLTGRAGRPDGVIYRQQYVRCGKESCRLCPPAGPGHGPYWYGFYWDYRQRTKSFYVGQRLPLGVTPLEPAPAPPTTPARPTAPHEGGDDQP